ncbi:hypothetical protein V8F20_001560 [Naviculisporaceae sp. PSN 640]
MAKDKKSAKSESKKAKLAEKKQKQEKKAEKKAKTKSAKQNDAGSDAEDVDLDAVLEEYRKQQEQFHKITETVVDSPPRARSFSTLLANPANSNQLLLFGGEYFNGALAQFFNDLMVYYIDRDEWRCVTSPNAPLPRSGHAWCRGGNQGNMVYLFGGEFSSPKQGTFYHYNDFWKLDCSTKEWERLEPKGKTPPARSGHRMTYFKQYIVLFGGFQDTANQTRYLADLWVYDTRNNLWHSPTLPPAQLKPEARSSFTLLPHEQGAVLYGGYSKVKGTTATNKQQGGKGGGGGGAQRNVLKSFVHQDCFFLRITPPAADAAPNVPPVVRWERRKKPANAPTPTRAGVTMAYHKGRGIMFGGVHDVDETEEALESEFFNDLFAWNIERNRFFPLALRKPRVQKKAGAGGEQRERVGRRGRAAANEEELLRQLAALQAGAGGGGKGDEDEMEIDKPAAAEEEEKKNPVKEMPVSMEFPHVRFNAQLAVQDDVLYIYGGTYEKDDREFTFDDLYAIDLGKMDGCKEIFSRPVEDWIQSDDEDDEDEEGDDGEDEDEEMEDEEGDVEMEDAKATKFTPSKRKKKLDEASEAASAADTASTAVSSEFDDNATEESTATTVDDGLPHPRPFESRRDFFQRTSNEWQEILMTNLRWKNIQPESLTVKEIKTKAFELSEEKWWDCREEITALEDEQEAAGIGEVVSLADRGEGTSGGGGHGGPRRR